VVVEAMKMENELKSPKAGTITEVFAKEGSPVEANAKLLKAISEIAFERIPEDPTSPRYRLGDTLGADKKHWFRDKFGNGDRDNDDGIL